MSSGKAGQFPVQGPPDITITVAVTVALPMGVVVVVAVVGVVGVVPPVGVPPVVVVLVQGLAVCVTVTVAVVGSELAHTHNTSRLDVTYRCVNPEGHPCRSCGVGVGRLTMLARCAVGIGWRGDGGAWGGWGWPSARAPACANAAAPQPPAASTPAASTTVADLPICMILS